MIIECISCKKKFDVNSDLIPETGRNIQCGSCDNIWFFIPKKRDLSIKEKIKPSRPKTDSDKEKIDNKPEEKIYRSKKFEKKNFEITKYQAKSNITLSKLLSYLIVIIISFVALIILIDTFKSILYDVFPNLESIIFSLFELLKDINLFFKDLI